MVRTENVFIGCNYWASHAGPDMWKNWQPEVVEKDLIQLKKLGLDIIRVFPNWRDFQPLESLYEYSNTFYEYRINEKPFPHTPAGRAGVDEVMIERFGVFADMSERIGLKLSVGLITGWMSGRIYCPPAFQEKNLIGDPEVVKWQIRFIQYFVRKFKDHPAIVMWGPGNECNCLGSFSRSEFWLWNHIVTETIRKEDGRRLIASGMHSLSPARYTDRDCAGSTILQDVAESYDLLTIHPYPIFTQYASHEGLGSFRSVFHIAGEHAYYSSLGKKTCFAEEFGTFTGLSGNEKTKYDYVANAMWNGWAHNCNGYLWWCGFDQDSDKAPYDWILRERDMGLVDKNRKPKNFANAMRETKDKILHLPFKSLPEQKTDFCCLLTDKQDHWGVAWGSFLLAKQAGLQITFGFVDDILPESDAYFLPCGNYFAAMHHHQWLELLHKVEAGATLFVSLDRFMDFSQFEQVFGIESLSCEEENTPTTVVLEDGRVMTIAASFRHRFVATEEKTVLRDKNGMGVLFRSDYGKGEIFLLDAPLELNVIRSRQELDHPIQFPYYEIYQIVMHKAMEKKALRRNNPLVTVTEHDFPDGKKAIVLVNNTSDEARTSVEVSTRFKITEVFYACLDRNILSISAHQGAVLLLEPTNLQNDK